MTSDLENFDAEQRWSLVQFKLEESEYFLGQIGAHSQFPRILWFYLSAFLASARSVTFHVQKLFDAGKDGKNRSVYDELCKKYLDSSESKYFVRLRNFSEKETFPMLKIRTFGVYDVPSDGSKTRVQIGIAFLTHPEPDKFEKLEKQLDCAHQPMATAELVWNFSDYPGEKSEISSVCSQYLSSLRALVRAFKSTVPAT